MWYRLRKTEAIRPLATDVLQLVSPALGFSLSRSRSSRQVSSDPRIPNGSDLLVEWNLLP